MIECSVCIATYDRSKILGQVLDSITRQQPPFSWEIIVVDDGSPTDETGELCVTYPEVIYLRRWRQPGYGNPAVARNMAYRQARGRVLICQSDDVLHVAPDTVHQLVELMQPGRFVLATVTNVDDRLRPVGCGHPRNPGLVELCGPVGGRPLLFLGAVYRSDVYEIGGNDERFIAPGKEDRYFVDCLMKGLGREPYFSSVKGYHLHHDRPPLDCVRPSDLLYDRLVAERTWRARGAPWPYDGEDEEGERSRGPSAVPDRP